MKQKVSIYIIYIYNVYKFGVLNPRICILQPEFLSIYYIKQGSIRTGKLHLFKKE